MTAVPPLFVPLKRVYPPAVAMLVPGWLAGMREWRPQQSDQYCFEGVDLNCHAHKHVGHIQHLVAPALLARLEDVARKTWGVNFSPAFHIEARRFRVGDYAAPHSDAALREVRAIVMFPSSQVRGGDLVFHGEGGATLAPRTNEGVVFTCSQENAHSVTRVQRGHRYSICYRFGTLLAGEPTETARP